MAYRILCSSCHQFLYWFKGDFRGGFQILDFIPANPNVPPPRPKDPMLCPVCARPWYILRQNGSIYVFTDKGWKPRAPDGEAPTTMRKGVQALLPEIPKDMQDGRGNYNERGRPWEF